MWFIGFLENSTIETQMFYYYSILNITIIKKDVIYIDWVFIRYKYISKEFIFIFYENKLVVFLEKYLFNLTISVYLLKY